MLLFRKLVDETQMSTTPEATSYHSSRKFSIFLPLRAIQNLSFHYETPCSNENQINILGRGSTYMVATPTSIANRILKTLMIQGVVVSSLILEQIMCMVGNCRRSFSSVNFIYGNRRVTLQMISAMLLSLKGRVHTLSQF